MYLPFTELFIPPSFSHHELNKFAEVSLTIGLTPNPLTNFVWQRPQWEVSSHLAHQEISYIRGAEYLLQTFKGVTARPCTEQDKSTGETKFFKNNFNIILPSTLYGPNVGFLSISITIIFVPQTSFAGYMFCQSHIGCSHHPSKNVENINYETWRHVTFCQLLWISVS